MQDAMYSEYSQYSSHSLELEAVALQAAALAASCGACHKHPKSHVRVAEQHATEFSSSNNNNIWPMCIAHAFLPGERLSLAVSFLAVWGYPPRAYRQPGARVP